MQIQKSFRDYIVGVNPRYVFHKHNGVIADTLQRVADDELKRLIILMPPRHGASEEISRLFPAYYLSRHPERFVGLATYSSGLAENFSRISRDRFLEIGGALNYDSEYIKYWGTKEGGGMFAVGVGGSIAGKGFHLGIIDSPVKNQDEAVPHILKRQQDWFSQTFLTREVGEGGAIIVVMPHVHEEDLVGYILAEEEKAEDGYTDNWHILNLTAIKEEPDKVQNFPASCTVETDWREPGEALCPERYPVEKLRATRARVGERMWWSWYQQNPAKANALPASVDENRPSLPRNQVFMTKANFDRYPAFRVHGVLEAELARDDQRLSVIELAGALLYALEQLEKGNVCAPIDAKHVDYWREWAENGLAPGTAMSESDLARVYDQTKRSLLAFRRDEHPSEDARVARDTCAMLRDALETIRVLKNNWPPTAQPKTPGELVSELLSHLDQDDLAPQLATARGYLQTFGLWLESYERSKEKS